MNAAKKKKIIKELKAAGWGFALLDDDLGWSKNGIVVSAEEWDSVKGKAGDYFSGYSLPGFDDFGTNLEVEAIANKNGAFSEWINPAVFAIHEI